jgi:hypothetical protein
MLSLIRAKGLVTSIELVCTTGAGEAQAGMLNAKTKIARRGKNNFIRLDRTFHATELFFTVKSIISPRTDVVNSI